MEDRARRGRDLFDHLCLDSDPPLYGPVRNDPNYVLGPGPDVPILIVAILEVIVALACVGTAVVLYSVVKRQHEGIAMGFVGSRVLEAATIFVGVVTLLSVVTLRQAAVGADALATSQALVAVNNWTFVSDEAFFRWSTLCCWAPCYIAPAWCLGSFRSWGGLERRCFSFPISACCSASGHRCLR
jgi:Domain of unknown function (DUF4386)